MNVVYMCHGGPLLKIGGFKNWPTREKGGFGAKHNKEMGIMSSVWDMILQWGSTIKVSIELPVATRHRRDMTVKLLKATLNPNTHTQRNIYFLPCLLWQARLYWIGFVTGAKQTSR